MPGRRRGWMGGGPPGGGPHGSQQHGRGQHGGGRHANSPQGELLRSPLAVSLLEPGLQVQRQEQPQHGNTHLSEQEAQGRGGRPPSVVYRALREMEELGWIASELDAAQALGPPRKIYRLVPQGEGALRNWQQELERTGSLIASLRLRMD